MLISAENERLNKLIESLGESSRSSITIRSEFEILRKNLEVQFLYRVFNLFIIE